MLPSELPDHVESAVCFDTETSGLHQDDGARVATVAVAWIDQGRTVAHAFPFDQGPLDKQPQGALELYGNPNLGEAEWVALLDWLGRQDLTAHNAKFDIAMMETGTRHWPGRNLQDSVSWCSMVVQRELDPIRPTGLKPSYERLFPDRDGSRRAEEVLKVYMKKQKVPKGRYDLVPWDVMEPYAATDAYMGIELWALQHERIEGGEAKMSHVRESLAVMHMLTNIERRGVPFDAAGCLHAAHDLRKARDRVEQELPFPPSINSAKRWFFEDRDGARLVPYDVTTTGKPKMDAEILRKMERDQVPRAAEYSLWRKLDYALSMWYESYPAMIGPDGRLRTSFRQTKEEDARTGGKGGGTVSDRFSSTRMNLQAIPHRHRLGWLPDGVPTIRELIRPEPGTVLYELDLAQAELRVAAKLARSARMLELIESEADLHGETAKDLFRTTEDSDDWFRYRQIAKRSNFSLIFGVGPDTFRATVAKETGIELSRSETEDIIARWRRIFPEFQRAIWAAQDHADRYRWVPVVNGRRRWFHDYEDTHKAFNQRVQMSLATFARRWALVTERYLTETGRGALVLLIHDSEVLELPDDSEAQETATEVARMGSEIGTRWFKIGMSVDVGKWGEH